MASASSTAAALFVAVLALLSSSSPAAARPGIPFHPRNALLVTYTISTTTDVSDNNPAFFPRRTTGIVSIYRIVTPFRRFVYSDDSYTGHRQPSLTLRRHHEISPLSRLEEVSAFGFSSLQDRAKDILVVVVGLLFGVSCAALTATTMHLFWSLITNRCVLFGAYDDEEKQEEEDVENLKKIGYVKIPTAVTAVAVAAPEKGVHEEN